ncbi:hypothetical protein ACFUTR_23735 [Streptomyces sp. NPDC057367]|uniref:hypothetical protein n=1 Tax=Streptomyces sp. NPDC057367 TaxID=3346108 RepID=UPI00362E71DA
MAEQKSAQTLPRPLHAAASVVRKVPGAGTVGRAAEGALDRIGAVSPRGRRAVVYTGAGALGIAGLVEWPVALTAGAVAWLTRPRPQESPEADAARALEEGGAGEEKTPARRSTAKKTAGTQTAARKSPATKSGAAKSGTAGTSAAKAGTAKKSTSKTTAAKKSTAGTAKKSAAGKSTSAAKSTAGRRPGKKGASATSPAKKAAKKTTAGASKSKAAAGSGGARSRKSTTSTRKAG